LLLKNYLVDGDENSKEVGEIILVHFSFGVHIQYFKILIKLINYLSKDERVKYVLHLTI
jgi:hypothetical protein